MTGTLKCPFCQQKLQYDDLLCSCMNEYCEESFDMVGTELLWQKVIDLKQELDRTHKALDVAVDALNSIVDYGKIACSELQKNALGQFQKPVSKMQDIAHLAIKQINQKG